MYVDYQLISIMFSHYILNIRKYKCMHITYSTLIGTLIDRWLYNWYRLVYFPFHQDKRKKNKNHEREEVRLWTVTGVWLLSHIKFR